RPPLLVSQSVSTRHAYPVSHHQHLLPCSIFGGSVLPLGPHTDCTEQTDVRTGRFCAALQPLAQRWVHVVMLLPATGYCFCCYLVIEVILHRCHCFSDDPVYIPLDAHIEEYIKSDYGLVYMGTPLNISGKPWSFGQYEPGVLEACLKLLQVSPEHLSDKQNDYIQRANPVYLSRVICAMVNSNDDLGILEGKWHGNYKGGIKPTDWSGSADILHRWVSSNCKPVRYGQCWVYASVLCTVMRVLGIPSRVVTVFNAAHDGDGSVKIEEIYSSTGEKLNLSKDSIWNFHVWVECWMRRPDLGPGFDGWQVVDPTPQEKSAGKFCCGPCPVVAIQQRCLHVPYDSSFVYASVDADIIRLIVHDGLVVQRVVDTESVGQLIYTKGIGSDRPNNLTQTYKSKTSQTGSCLWTGQIQYCLKTSTFVWSPSLRHQLEPLLYLTGHAPVPVYCFLLNYPQTSY
uniref:Transglutaminase-like domain-containing protein n=1 Tax=Dicentrarchus labrax TaxID=13489 RepID=A0A8P4GSV5_DICLA